MYNGGQTRLLVRRDRIIVYGEIRIRQKPKLT